MQQAGIKLSVWKRIFMIGCMVLPMSCTIDVLAQGNSDNASLSPDIVLKFPEQSPGAPFYAISGNGGFVPTDGEWAAIPFHRELDCVPLGANLLQLAIPFAFGCELTVEGVEHWENGPFVDLAPRETQSFGLGAVPIVFARWSEVEPALAGGLTLEELLSLPSAIIGTALFYKETDIFGISGPHGPGRGSYKINARGSLSDGRKFSLLVNEVLGQVQEIQISFGT
jgi:hypothetical protein